MKKNFVFAMMSAIALTGAVCVSSCSSSEDVADVNPTYDGEAVKTQFTISLPSNLTNKTRQTSSVVQQAQTISSFRGMEGIVLIPFSNSTDRTTRLGANITLGASKMIAPTADNGENAIPAGKLLDNSNAVLYNDVTIPVGTAGFLFYGKATGTDGFADGSLTAAGLTGETSGISFTPTPILTNDPDLTVGNRIATYVSSIAAAADATDATITWAGCANDGNSTQPWYNSGLGELYTAFTSMKAGASSYVLAAVQDLYASIYKNTDKVSVAIRKAILASTYVSDEGSTGTLTVTDALKGYPADNNMPEGAAALSWTTATPAVATAVAVSNFGHNVTTGGMSTINMSNITYPASLYYFVDSDLKTSNTSRLGDYDGTNDWAGTSGILSKYVDGVAVSSATRSVAITDPIQYGVGRLDVKVNAMNASKYYDRKGEEVTIPTDGFQLTGILIGGQKCVNYKFEQANSTNDATIYTGTEYTIYDNTINKETYITDPTSTTPPTASDKVTSSAAAGPNYTLALETAANQKVYVALEFVNNAEDFRGFDGIVKKGCKFYMIAQLNPESDVADHVSGVDNTGNKVFKQDFNTIANFTIGAGSADANNDGEADNPAGLANAYTTIPDLRTPQLELGFSVDLTWRKGIQFDIVF